MSGLDPSECSHVREIKIAVCNIEDDVYTVKNIFYHSKNELNQCKLAVYEN